MLKAALQTEARYIGSLGSRVTHAMRCETLREMGVAEQSLPRLCGPIGLVPSLRDASFIAVSALAEIVAQCPPAVQQIDGNDRPAKHTDTYQLSVLAGQ